MTSSNTFENYDWDSLLSKLPIKNNKEEREKRRQMWKAMDMNGNGFVSLAEFDRGIRDVLNLPEIFKIKKVIIRAYQAAKNKYKGKSKYSDDYLEWMEFRISLVYLI
jgi:hypothetical protein